MQTKLGGKFWCAMLVFGLMGQVAWVVENMYMGIGFSQPTTRNSIVS